VSACLRGSMQAFRYDCMVESVQACSVCMCAALYLYTINRRRARTHIYIHTYIHTHIHTYTHILTRTAVATGSRADHVQVKVQIHDRTDGIPIAGCAAACMRGRIGPTLLSMFLTRMCCMWCTCACVSVGCSCAGACRLGSVRLHG
jgi:hypothetical protein